MAFASSLSDGSFSKYYDLLEVQVSIESKTMYIANKRKPGQYKGEWFDLFNRWLNDEVPNIHVINCLRAGICLQEYL